MQSNIGFAPLGLSIGGGNIICKSGGVAWIVAPATTEISRSRNGGAFTDSITVAQAVTGCIGWFVPDCNQVQNPGYTCREYWDEYSLTWYMSSTSHAGTSTWVFNYSTGSMSTFQGPATGLFDVNCVRTFRCIAY